MSKPNEDSSDLQQPLASEALPGSVRTSISWTRFMRQLTSVRVAEGGFASDSAYLAELVRHDAQKGIVAPRITTRKWENILKAA